MNHGRIISEHKTNYRLRDGQTEYLATVRGTFFADKEFPRVGDYVHYSPLEDNKAVIEDILPRTSQITRKAAHTDTTQTIVANVDVMFIVMSVDGDFNLSRLERYLFLAEQNAIDAVVLLNKIDSVEDAETYITKATTVAGTTPVVAISAITGTGMEHVNEYIQQDTTAVLLGSSGAGKSTITNWLLGKETQATKNVRRDDSRGRHTTTARELFVLPGGGYLIDTPGMRELGVTGNTSDAESEVFNQIEYLAQECMFNNCDHEKSKGCAIQEALQRGEINAREVRNYQKLKKEQEYMESKQDEESERQYKQRKKQWHKDISKTVKRKQIERDFE